MKKNPFPFNWMSKNTSFIFQDSCVGDIDFPWQIEATKWWLKKYLKKIKDNYIWWVWISRFTCC